MKILVTIYKKKNFKIYDCGNNKDYIIHNTSLEFKDHHTHVKNFNTCKFLIDLSIHKSIPNHLSDYLIVSLIRLTSDSNYKFKLESLLNSKKRGKIYAKESSKSKRNNKHHTS